MGLLFPQLTGVPTESVDCGISATRTAIKWATRGTRSVGVRNVRRRMGPDKVYRPGVDLKKLATSPTDWQRAIESFDTPGELGGQFERLTGTLITGSGWDVVDAHLDGGGMALLAVDYGVYRRIMPAKAGSLTFSGYHAVAFRGKGDRIMSLDSLLDGRYRGCPDGPVRVPRGKVRQAAFAVGKKELGRNAVHGYLVDRATALGEGVDIPEPEEPLTLASILADLREIREATGETMTSRELARVIDDLEYLIGPYEGEAEPDDEPEEGVTT